MPTNHTNLVCWLHDVHYHTSKESPSPWVSDIDTQEDSELRRRDALRHVAVRAARGDRISTARPSRDLSPFTKPHVDVQAERSQVFFSRKRLSLAVQDGTDGKRTYIPLLLSDIIYAQVEEGSEQKGQLAAHYVLAIGVRPQTGDHHDSTWSTVHSEPPLTDVWLVCVGKCTTGDLQSLLFQLGSLGATRWDLHDIYQITSYCLGEGGCGKVLVGEMKRVTRDKRNIEVAVKVLDLKKQPRLRKEDAIRDEIGFLARVHGHANLPTLFGAFCEEDKHSDSSWQDGSHQEQSQQMSFLRWYIVMELCPGGDLFDLIAAQGALSIADAIEVVKSTCSALRHLHRLRIVHRDVKTDNILMTSKGPVLADLGISANLDDSVSMQQSVGTPGFAAPEIVVVTKTLKQYDEKVDLFSTGVVFYFSLTATLPFEGSSLASVLVKTARCSISFQHSTFSKVPESLLALVKELLSKHPEERPSAKQAFSALLALQEGHSSHQLGTIGEAFVSSQTDQQQCKKQAEHIGEELKSCTTPNKVLQARQVSGAMHVSPVSETSQAPETAKGKRPVHLATSQEREAQVAHAASTADSNGSAPNSQEKKEEETLKVVPPKTPKPSRLSWMSQVAGRRLVSKLTPRTSSSPTVEVPSGSVNEVPMARTSADSNGRQDPGSQEGTPKILPPKTPKPTHLSWLSHRARRPFGLFSSSAAEVPFDGIDTKHEEHDNEGCQHGTLTPPSLPAPSCERPQCSAHA
eukprot:TRINITY_DN64257_c0_g1_i1.p1 TRINITY_DN64257_c0_g1~~TRINITY_DN64257_c0_g1_i1.p1  ORF type:complete len:744 (-),score=138.62 TRINITY_DN64257_c0_g1_i1:5-2236(-)